MSNMAKGTMARAAVLAALCVAGCAQKPDPGMLVRSWVNSVSQLEIYPIFPPSENVVPGDVFVGRIRPPDVPDNGGWIAPAIWFDTIKLDLPGYYATRPAFRKSAVTFDKDHEQWQQPPEAITRPGGADSGRLRLVVFPAFSFASATATQLGLNAPGGTIGGLFGLSSRDELQLSISVPAAEEYGVPARVLLAAFNREYAAQPQYYADFRRVAGMVAAPGAAPGVGKPVLLLVYRVYFARSMDYNYAARSGFAATGSATLASLVGTTGKIEAVENQLKALAGGGTTPELAAPAAAAAAQPRPLDPAAAAKVTALADTLGKLRNDLAAEAQKAVPSVPGATASVVAVSGNTVTLRQTFPRPVAIGYRALTLAAPDPDNGGAASGSNTPDPATANRPSVPSNPPPRGTPAVPGKASPSPPAAPSNPPLFGIPASRGAMNPSVRQPDLR
jgi:hypothetical protein